MIGKITTGSNFSGLFRYLLKEEKRPYVVDGDFVLVQDDPLEIGEQFAAIAQTRPSTKKPVKHISISFAPGDGAIADEQKSAIAHSVVKELGYTNNQWLAIVHHRDDPGHDWEHDHDHLHIAINMIDLDGQRVSDSFDKRRLEKILRGLEIKYNLTQVQSSQEVQRLKLATNQIRRLQRQFVRRKVEANEIKLPTMIKLQAAVDAASADHPSITTFVGRLQHLGVDVRPYITNKGRKRISYKLDDLVVRGCKLYNGSFPKLIAERQIDFNFKRDKEVIKSAGQGEQIEIDKQDKICWNNIDLNKYLPQYLNSIREERADYFKAIKIVSVLSKFLDKHQLSQFEGQNYRSFYREKKLELWHKLDKRCLFQAAYDSSGREWMIEGKIDFKEKDKSRLESFCNLVSVKQSSTSIFINRDRER